MVSGLGIICSYIDWLRDFAAFPRFIIEVGSSSSLVGGQQGSSNESFLY